MVDFMAGGMCYVTVEWEHEWSREGTAVNHRSGQSLSCGHCTICPSPLSSLSLSLSLLEGGSIALSLWFLSLSLSLSLTHSLSLSLSVYVCEAHSLGSFFLSLSPLSS